MKRIYRILLCVCCIAILATSVSCADMGEGDSETAFYDYFSKVYLYSLDGRKKKSIRDFNEVITMAESDEIKEVVPQTDYRYIVFKVADGYTLQIEEFAFFAKGDEGEKLVLDFFVSDVLPTKMKNEDEKYTYLPKEENDQVTVAAETAEPVAPEETEPTGTGTVEIDEDGNERYVPETDEDGNLVERPDEVGEDIFSLDGYARTVFHLSKDWDSIHLAFEKPQVVKSGEYIVIRVRNNCFLDLEKYTDVTSLEDLWMLMQNSVNFTFNYLMFRFTQVTKE